MAHFEGDKVGDVNLRIKTECECVLIVPYNWISFDGIRREFRPSLDRTNLEVNCETHIKEKSELQKKSG